MIRAHVAIDLDYLTAQADLALALRELAEDLDASRVCVGDEITAPTATPPLHELSWEHL